jgi:hypothetical protein
MILFDYFMNGPFKARELMGHDRHFSETNYRICLQIGKVAELLAFVAVYDPHTMIELNKWFDQIVPLATSEGQLQVAAIAKSAAHVSEELIISQTFEDAMAGRTLRTQKTDQAQKVSALKSEIVNRLADKLTQLGVKIPDWPDQISASSDTESAVAAMT